MAIDAVIRNLEVIGEAVKKIPDGIKKKYPGVEWKEAAGFRDILIHDYFRVDLKGVWDTIKNNILSFKAHILRVLRSEKGTEENNK